MGDLTDPNPRPRGGLGEYIQPGLDYLQPRSEPHRHPPWHWRDQWADVPHGHATRDSSPAPSLDRDVPHVTTATRRTRAPVLRRALVIPAAVLSLGLFVSACSSYYAEWDTLPHAYLLQAKQAAERHDTAKTLAALNQAENVYLGTSPRPYRNPVLSYDTEAVVEMGQARLAVQMQRWDDALYYINTAITHPSTLIPY